MNLSKQQDGDLSNIRFFVCFFLTLSLSLPPLCQALRLPRSLDDCFALLSGRGARLPAGHFVGFLGGMDFCRRGRRRLFLFPLHFFSRLQVWKGTSRSIIHVLPVKATAGGGPRWSTCLAVCVCERALTRVYVLI